MSIHEIQYDIIGIPLSGNTNGIIEKIFSLNADNFSKLEYQEIFKEYGNLTNSKIKFLREKFDELKLKLNSIIGSVPLVMFTENVPLNNFEILLVPFMVKFKLNVVLIEDEFPKR